MQDTDAQQVDISTRNVIRVLRETHVEKKKWDDDLDVAVKAGYCVSCRRPWPCEGGRIALALESAAPRNTDPSALTNANVLAHFINTNESLTSEQYRAMSAGVDALRAAAPTVREAKPTWADRVEDARNALTEYDRRDHAWDMVEAAEIVLRAAFPERAPESL